MAAGCTSALIWSAAAVSAQLELLGRCTTRARPHVVSCARPATSRCAGSRTSTIVWCTSPVAFKPDAELPEDTFQLYNFLFYTNFYCTFISWRHRGIFALDSCFFVPQCRTFSHCVAISAGAADAILTSRSMLDADCLKGRQ